MKPSQQNFVSYFKSDFRDNKYNTTGKTFDSQHIAKRLNPNILKNEKILAR